MQHIIKALEDQFYTPAFRIVGLILVLIVSLKHRKKFIPLKYFPFYATTLLLYDVFFYWYHIAEEANYHGDFFWGLSSYLDYLFTFVELIFFSHFYYHLSYTQIIKKLILVFNVFFGLFFVYMAIKDKYFYEGVSGVTQSIVYTVESIILLFLCSFYFIDLFKKLPVVNLKNEPGFWVSTGLIITLILMYQKKQLAYQQKLETLKLDHEKNLMAAQLEIQEDTFQHISKEIHDNISLSLTLAKLNLNTLSWTEKEKAVSQLNTSIELISQSITNLSDISKSLNSDIIASQGLITAVKNELQRIREIGLFNIDLNIPGNPVYMDIQRELIIFRIIQEAFNNIIK